MTGTILLLYVVFKPKITVNVKKKITPIWQKN